MARKTTAAKADNDNTAAGVHPLFPNIAAGTITALRVNRVVYERRKGRPGYERQSRVQLTAQPLPPLSLVTEEQLAELGAGHLELVPLQQGNRFAGEPFSLKVPDDQGQVPLYVDQWEPTEEEQAAAQAPRNPLEDLLREQNRFLREQLDDERKRRGFDLEQMQKVHDRNLDGFGGLMDKILQAQAAATAPSAGGGANDAMTKFFMDRVAALETRLDNKSTKEIELREKIAGARSGKGSDDGEMGVKFFVEQGMPMLKDELDKRRELKQREVKALEEAVAVKRAQLEARNAPVGTVIDGKSIPALGELKEYLEGGGVLDESGARVFRELDGRGMLPRAYVECLRAAGVLSAEGQSAGQA
jgi:hypothetical protein